MAGTILIVEDSEISRAMLCSILSEEYGILVAENGEEALAILRKHARSISAIVLDLQMPVMDGFEVLRRVRANAVWGQIPVVITTAQDDDESELRALSLGANEFVAKPYKPALLLNRLRNIIQLRETASVVNAIRRDALTHLYNREGFFLCAGEMIDRHAPGYYLLASFDVDNFKVINDQYGSDKGDEVLCRIAEIIKSAIEPIGGICCRFGGDTFAALYPRDAFHSEALVNMRRRLSRPDESIQPIAFSIGIYPVDDPSMSLSAMYDRAAIARQTTKGHYDAHIAWYDDAMRERILRQQQIVTRMRGALRDEEFEAWFQPQYNHATGALIGAEALVRWRDAQSGMIVPPGDFIPVFERNGFIYEMDKYIWERACAFLRKWLDNGFNPLPVSVNISRQDFFHEDFFDALTGLMEKYAIPVSLLRLEITESAFSTSTQQIVAAVKRLVAFGFEVEIDDFGSGYSSLNTLKDVPASILKLDMRFLESAEDSQRGGNILQSVVRMSKWLGMSVIAEGVETKAQADYLKSIGCLYVQGYYYARPMPGNEYEALLTHGTLREKLMALETVENLDNNAFWDPKSMDTLIFNSYVGGACICEYQDGRAEILRVNDKYRETFGANVSADAIFADNTTDSMDGESRRTLLSNIRRAVETGGECTCETAIRDLYGQQTRKYIRSTVRVIARAGDRYLLYCMVDDMTRQREAERKERETASRIAAIMGNITGGVTAMVMGGGETRLLFANDQFYRLLGYTQEQFAAEVKAPFDSIAPEDRARVLAEAENCSKTREPFTTTYRFVRRDGTTGWMRSAISVTAFPDVNEPVQLAVATDITAERENAVMMDELINAIPGGVVIYRVGAGFEIETLYSSDGVAKLTGVSDKEHDKWIHGDLITAALYEDDAPMARSRIAAAVSSGDPINMTFRLKHKDGYPVWVAFSASKIREDAKGKIYYGVFTRPEAETALYRSLVEDSTTASVILEKRNRKILYANPAWRRTEAISEDREIVGVSAFDLLPGNALYFSDDDIRALPADRYVSFYRTSSIGRKLSGQARSMIWNGVDAYVCHMTDETELWNSRKQLQRLIDRVPVGIGICKIEDGRLSLTYVNDAYYKLLGYSREERKTYFGPNVIDAIHPDDRAQVMEGVAKLAKGGSSADVVYRAIKGDGEPFWIRILASVVGRKAGVTTVYCALTDFDSAMRSRREMESGRAMLAAALKSARVMVWRYDYKTRTITDAGSIGEMFSLPGVLDNLPGSLVDSGYICPESAEDLRALFEEVALEKLASRDVRIKPWKDKPPVWVRLIYTPVFDKNGRYLEAIGTSIDITEQKEQEIKYGLVRMEQVVDTLMKIDYESVLIIDARTGQAQPIVSGHIGEVVNEQKRMGDNVAGVESYLRKFCVEADVERAVRETSLPFVLEKLKEEPTHAATYTIRREGKTIRKRVVYAYLDPSGETILCAMRNLETIEDGSAAPGEKAR